jgi:hypothetical protein
MQLYDLRVTYLLPQVVAVNVAGLKLLLLEASLPLLRWLQTFCPVYGQSQVLCAGTEPSSGLVAALDALARAGLLAMPASTANADLALAGIPLLVVDWLYASQSWSVPRAPGLSTWAALTGLDPPRESALVDGTGGLALRPDLGTGQVQCCSQSFAQLAAGLSMQLVAGDPYQVPPAGQCSASVLFAAAGSSWSPPPPPGLDLSQSWDFWAMPAFTPQDYLAVVDPDSGGSVPQVDLHLLQRGGQPNSVFGLFPFAMTNVQPGSWGSNTSAFATPSLKSSYRILIGLSYSAPSAEAQGQLELQVLSEVASGDGRVAFEAMAQTSLPYTYAAGDQILSFSLGTATRFLHGVFWAPRSSAAPWTWNSFLAEFFESELAWSSRLPLS